MTLRPPYDARAVANLLLDFAEQQGSHLTQISLLKIIYFAHGWYLAESGMPLIKQPFEAWKYGPVIKVVRDEFKGFGREPITSRACMLDIYTGESVFVEPDVAPDDRYFISNIFNAYHVYDAWKLSDMTHETDSPWDVIWNSSEPTGRLALRIRNEDIKEHFSRTPRRFRLS